MSGFGGDTIGFRTRLASAIYVADSTERLALSSLRDGQLVVQVSDNTVYSWDSTGSSWVPVGGGLITGISDTNTIDLTETTGDLKADVKYQDTASVDFSDDASGLKADVLPAGVDHDQLLNTHNLTTDVDHDSITNTHNLSTDIDHDTITNSHNLTTDIDHNTITNNHNLTTDIDHTAITNVGVRTHDDLDAIFDDTKEPTGFVNASDALLSFVNATRTLAINPSASSFDYYITGTKYTSTGTSVVIPDTEGIHFIYFDGATLTSTMSFSDSLITEKALVSIIYWDAVNSKQIYFGKELHGCTMDSNTHLYLHQTIGSALSAGGELGDIDADATSVNSSSAQFSNAATTLWDEDIEFNHSARTSTSNIPVYYRTGLDASGIWRLQDTTSFPIVTSGTGRASWNELTGGSWQLTEVNNLDFVLAHVVSTNDVTRPFVALVGQNTYTTVNNARAGALVEVDELITSGLPFVEFKFLGSIIYQTSNTYTGNIVKSRIRSTDAGFDYVDLRGSVITRNGTSGTVTSHNDLADIQGGSATERYHLSAADEAKVVAVSGDIVGNSDSQTLTNKTIDADNNTISNLAHGAEVDNPTSGVHGATGTIVGDSDTQTLTNKSIDSDNNTITNIVNADIKAAAGIVESKLTLDYSTSSLNTAVGTKQDDVITTRGDIIRGSSTNTAERLPLGTSGQYLTSDGTDIAWSSVTVGAPEIVIYKDVKSSGTNGGNATSGSWESRTLNTTENPQSWESLSSSTVTLSAGTYKIDIQTVALGTDRSKIRWRNIDDSTTAVVGLNSENSSASGDANSLNLSGIFTITAEKDFQLESRTQTSGVFGYADSFGENEVYAIVKIEKIGA